MSVKYSEHNCWNPLFNILLHTITSYLTIILHRISLLIIVPDPAIISALSKLQYQLLYLQSNLLFHPHFLHKVFNNPLFVKPLHTASFFSLKRTF